MRMHPVREKRKAGVAPLTAVLSIPMLAMLAFSVDVSYVVLVRTELQSAADAGALAGAQSLGANYATWYQGSSAASVYTGQATTAISNVITANSAGGQALTCDSATDVEYGNTTSGGAYTGSYTNYPNTVKVWARRDATGSAKLNLFFSPVIGINSVDVTAVAGATLQTGTISAASSNIPGLTGSDLAGILPLTYNVNWWNNFLLTG